MDNNDFPVATILTESRRFMVPLYPRKYQWDDVPEQVVHDAQRLDRR